MTSQPHYPKRRLKKVTVAQMCLYMPGPKCPYKVTVAQMHLSRSRFNGCNYVRTCPGLYMSQLCPYVSGPIHVSTGFRIQSAMRIRCIILSQLIDILCVCLLYVTDSQNTPPLPPPQPQILDETPYKTQSRLSV